MHTESTSTQPAQQPAVVQASKAAQKQTKMRKSAALPQPALQSAAKQTQQQAKKPAKQQLSKPAAKQVKLHASKPAAKQVNLQTSKPVAKQVKHRSDVVSAVPQNALHLLAKQDAQFSNVYPLSGVLSFQTSSAANLGEADIISDRESLRVSVSRPSRKLGPIGSQARTRTSLEFPLPKTDVLAEGRVSNFSKKKDVSQMIFSTDKSAQMLN